MAIALSRSQHDFTDSECELLTVARPHLIQVYRNALEFTDRTASRERPTASNDRRARLLPRTPSTNVVRRGGPATCRQPHQTAATQAAHGIFHDLSAIAPDCSFGGGQRRQSATAGRVLRPATIRERDGAGVIAFIEGGAPSQRLHWRLPVLVGGSCRVTALLGCRAARCRPVGQGLGLSPVLAGIIGVGRS
jgi:hypothetical protein